MDIFFSITDYATYEYMLSAAMLVCAMFGMGAKLSVRNFVGVAKSPWGLCLVIVMQIVAMPFIALLFAKAFALPSGIAVGLVLVTALPGGLFSNIATYLGHGNIALSIAATAICTIGSVLTSVYVLRIFATSELPFDLAMPAGAILTEVLWCLLLPLILGMVLKRVLPSRSDRISVWCVRASLVLLILVVAGAVLSGRLNFWAYGWKIPLLVLVFALIALWLTYGVALLSKLNTDDAFTVAMEVLVRNAHLGLLLKAALFPASDTQHVALADGVLYCLLLYSGIALGIAGSEIYGKHKKLGPIFGVKKQIGVGASVEVRTDN